MLGGYLLPDAMLASGDAFKAQPAKCSQLNKPLATARAAPYASWAIRLSETGASDAAAMGCPSHSGRGGLTGLLKSRLSQHMVSQSWCVAPMEQGLLAGGFSFSRGYITMC